LLFGSLFLVWEVKAQSDRSQIIALMKQQEPDACNNVSFTVDAETVKLGPGSLGLLVLVALAGGPEIYF
jgi:hypothetical protein